MPRRVLQINAPKKEQFGSKIRILCSRQQRGRVTNTHLRAVHDGALIKNTHKIPCIRHPSMETFNPRKGQRTIQSGPGGSDQQIVQINK